MAWTSKYQVLLYSALLALIMALYGQMSLVSPSFLALSSSLPMPRCIYYSLRSGNVSQLGTVDVVHVGCEVHMDSNMVRRGVQEIACVQ